MKPIYLTVMDELPLMIIPDSQAHADGHPVLTYTYSIYRDKRKEEGNELPDPETLLTTEKKNDPAYMGYITFEQPGKLFTYTSDGKERLTSDEVEEIIEQISEYRDSPQMWNIGL
jgi:hypothetical protein